MMLCQVNLEALKGLAYSLEGRPRQAQPLKVSLWEEPCNLKNPPKKYSPLRPKLTSSTSTSNPLYSPPCSSTSSPMCTPSLVIPEPQSRTVICSRPSGRRPSLLTPAAATASGLARPQPHHTWKPSSSSRGSLRNGKSGFKYSISLKKNSRGSKKHLLYTDRGKKERLDH